MPVKMKRYFPAIALLASLATPALAQSDDTKGNERVENTTEPGSGPLPILLRGIPSILVPTEGADSVEVDLKSFFETFDYPGPILNFAIETGSGEGLKSDNVRVQLYYADPYPEDDDFFEYEIPDGDDEDEEADKLSNNMDLFAPNAAISLLGAASQGLFDDSIFHGIYDDRNFQFLFGGLWKKSEDPKLDLEPLPLYGASESGDRSILPKLNDFIYIRPLSGETIGSFQFHLGASEGYAFNMGALAGRIIGEETVPPILKEIFEWQEFGFSSISSFAVPLKDYTPEDLENFKRVAWENYARIKEVSIENQTDHQIQFELVKTDTNAGVTVELTPDGVMTLTLDKDTLERGANAPRVHDVEFQIKVDYTENEEPKTRLERYGVSFALYGDLEILAGGTPLKDNPGYWTTGLFGRVFVHYVAPEEPEGEETEGEETVVLDPASDGIWAPGEWFWSERHGYIYPAVTREELHALSDNDGDGIAGTWEVRSNGFWLYNQSPAEEGDLGWMWTSFNLWPTFYSYRYGEWLHFMHSSLVMPDEEEGQTAWKDDRVYWSWEYKHPEGPFWGEFVTAELVDGVVQLIKYEPPSDK